MDTSRYKALFVTEARELLAELADAVYYLVAGFPLEVKSLARSPLPQEKPIV